jgi:nucleoid DNA-binding protein/ribosomal protein S27AE
LGVSEVKVKKAEIDREVALQLGKTPKQVGIITKVFLHTVMIELLKMGDVQLDGLGTMRLKRWKGGIDRLRNKGGQVMNVETSTVHRVSFRKSNVLNEAIRVKFGRAKPVEDVMDKYGVDETGTELEKKAAAGCPNCGGKVEKHGNVLACEKCGTEPFEGSKTK